VCPLLSHIPLAERVLHSFWGFIFFGQAQSLSFFFTSRPLLVEMLFNSILLTLLPALALAANDWSKPCTSGTCSYESGDGKNTAWSNLVIVRSLVVPHISVLHNFIRMQSLPMLSVTSPPLLVGKSSDATRSRQTPKTFASSAPIRLRGALSSSMEALRIRSSVFLRTVLVCVAFCATPCPHPVIQVAHLPVSSGHGLTRTRASRLVSLSEVRQVSKSVVLLLISISRRSPRRAS
jgi:hypothetical protein